MPDLDFVIAEFQDSELPRLTPRDVVLPEVPRKPNVVIGMRRTGKTYVLYQEMHRLLAAGVDKRDILYVNFEDDRLYPLQEAVLDNVLEAFFRRNPEARERGCHVFLDEVQTVPGFARFARRVVDTLPARLYLTGSSASLLHTDVATEFRGRGLAVEVFPMSFAETARHRGLDVFAGGAPSPRVRSLLLEHLDWYLEVGGFPEVLDLPRALRIQTLQDYVELVLLRDVIERHRVENAVATRAFSRLLLQSSGQRFSVNKAHKDLKSRGFQVSKDTMHSLLAYFEDAYLVYTVPIFSQSERVIASNPRKTYAVDPGLASALSHVTATNLGARLETAVFLELRRRAGRMLSGEISFYVTAQGHEIDFVVGDPFTRHASGLIQVSASVADPSTREREVRALTAGMQELGIRKSTVITMSEADIVEVESGTIAFVPAWQWFSRQPDEPAEVGTDATRRGEGT
ncbi:MAG: ATP-binding protein [Coriobacteriia bacterium]|nr:ATP-binding protein [Coriobacteriia bacterium]